MNVARIASAARFAHAVRAPDKIHIATAHSTPILAYDQNFSPKLVEEKDEST
jgi:hypothetical protein